jgi:hypothetical protein
MSLKSFRSRVGSVVRRSSLAFPTPRPSTPRSDSASDAGSIKQSQSDTSSVAPVDTTPLTLSPPTNGLSVQAPSPIAESPAREAAAMAAEVTGLSPLQQVVTESPAAVNADLPAEPSSTAPEINEIPPTPLNGVLDSESKLPPAAADETVPQTTDYDKSATEAFGESPQGGDGVDAGVTTMPAPNVAHHYGAVEGDATFAWGFVFILQL